MTLTSPDDPDCQQNPKVPAPPGTGIPAGHCGLVITPLFTLLHVLHYVTEHPPLKPLGVYFCVKALNHLPWSRRAPTHGGGGSCKLLGDTGQGSTSQVGRWGSGCHPPTRGHSEVPLLADCKEAPVWGPAGSISGVHGLHARSCCRDTKASSILHRAGSSWHFLSRVSPTPPAPPVPPQQDCRARAGDFTSPSSAGLQGTELRRDPPAPHFLGLPKMKNFHKSFPP